jgi:hypothetical protein
LRYGQAEIPVRSIAQPFEDTMIHRSALFLAFVLVACANPEANQLPQPTAWKAILIAGDNAEPAFDNAVDAMAGKLTGYGLGPQDIVVLKASATDGHAADKPNIVEAFATLNPTDSEGCFVFITSHGDAGRGLVIRGAQSFLTPDDLDGLLNRSCANRPTVVIASGCLSSNFADGKPMTAVNRTILTAARRDRTSFGCNANRHFTVFDECVLDGLDRGVPWAAVVVKTEDCVTRYENEAKVYPPSEPQLFIGFSVERLLLF